VDATGEARTGRLSIYFRWPSAAGSRDVDMMRFKSKGETRVLRTSVVGISLAPRLADTRLPPLHRRLLPRRLACRRREPRRRAASGTRRQRPCRRGGLDARGRRLAAPRGALWKDVWRGSPLTTRNSWRPVFAVRALGALRGGGGMGEADVEGFVDEWSSFSLALFFSSFC